LLGIEINRILAVTVIDQRILIAASVEYVWVYLTEPAHISKWNRGAKQLSMLTARADGVGTRRRCVNTRGQSVVEEITAWLPPYGYEYHVIDGPYRRLTGRLRLQSVPEGTQIQWIIDYELRGFLNGLRDRLGYRRQMRLQLADSLRGLRKMIEASGVRLDREKQAKVAMQADPGFAARLARSADPTRQSAPLPLPPEPLVTIGDDDLPELPPEPIVSMPTTVGTHEPTPSFVTIIPTAVPPTAKTKPLNERRPDPLVDDTKPRPPAGLQEAVAALTTIRPATVPVEQPPTPASGQTTVSAALVAPRLVDPTTQTVAPMPRIPAAPPPPMPPMPLAPAMPTVAPLSPISTDKPATPSIPIDSPTDNPEKEKYDMGEMSIWDVFGLDRPSERNKVQLDEVIASLQTPLPDRLPPISLPPASPEQVNIESFSTPPPPPLEAMHAIIGRIDREKPAAIGKSPIAIRHIVAPQHAKTTVKIRGSDGQ
jgi:hypothetical protein